MPSVRSTLPATPAPFSAEIIALADKPIQGASAPRGFSNSSTNLRLRIQLLEKALASYDLDNLTNVDADAATKIEGLFEKLEAAKKLQVTQEANLESQRRMLEEVERSIAMQLNVERACEARGHRREDGLAAIGGLMAENHGFIGNCMRCGKNFRGLGSNPGELPMHIWNAVDQNTIGKA